MLTLGCDISPGEPGRTDRIIQWRGKVAVLEVKGLTKSAKESDAAQLEKWVSEYTMQNESVPKGILLVNGWRRSCWTSVTRRSFRRKWFRTQRADPTQLVAASQLLTAWLTCTSKAKKATFLKAMFENTGVLEGWDWHDAISVIVGEAEA